MAGAKVGIYYFYMHTHRGSLFVNGLMKEVTYCDLSRIDSQLVYNTINLTEQNKYCINAIISWQDSLCAMCAFWHLQVRF